MGKQANPATTGDSTRHSEWLRVNQQLIDDYAEVSGDHHFLHVDPEQAATTIFGGTIAHGLLTLSLLPRMAQEIMGADILPRTAGVADMVINYGFDRVRFITPVRAGSEIRAHMEPGIEETREPGQTLIRSTVRVELRGSDKPAMVADMLALRFEQD